MITATRVFLLVVLGLLSFPETVAWTCARYVGQTTCTLRTARSRNVAQIHDPRATATRLSVFGWWQNSDDESTEAESKDKAISANLSGVAGIMSSMNSFKTSQRVSDRTNAVLQDLANTMVEGTAADGKVKVTYNGQQRPMGVQIDEGYFQSLGRKSGAGELNTALKEAMQEAHKKSGLKMEEKLKALYAELGFDTR